MRLAVASQPRQVPRTTHNTPAPNTGNSRNQQPLCVAVLQCVHLTSNRIMRAWLWQANRYKCPAPTIQSNAHNTGSSWVNGQRAVVSDNTDSQAVKSVWGSDAKPLF